MICSAATRYITAYFFVSEFIKIYTDYCFKRPTSDNKFKVLNTIINRIYFSHRVLLLLDQTNLCYL